MNYSELVSAAQTYADKNDIEVSGSMDTFIMMAEARMNRVLKTREQSTRSYTPAIDTREYYSLPFDYRGMRNVKVLSAVPGALEYTIFKLTYVNPEMFDQRINSTNDEHIYTVEANQMRVYPKIPTGYVIEMTYWQKVPNLSATNDTNWMSEEHPDIYLAGIVSEIEIFTKNYEVGEAWDAKMTRSINELKESDIQEITSGKQLVTVVK
jgi:hypothetical protein